MLVAVVQFQSQFPEYTNLISTWVETEVRGSKFKLQDPVSNIQYPMLHHASAGCRLQVALLLLVFDCVVCFRLQSTLQPNLMKGMTPSVD